MIIIPMMGRSSRFFDAGYSVPKYELPLAGASVFDHVLRSFADYFDDEHFLFVVRQDFGGTDYVKQRLEAHNIRHFEIVELAHDTLGQADTVYQGLQRTQASAARLAEPLVIFNADSFLLSFRMPTVEELKDGMLEVFVGEGDHWSFVRPGEDSTVLETREKVRISSLCSDGLYFFRSAGTFTHAFEKAVTRQVLEHGEYYVAPLYNFLIEDEMTITYRVIDRSEYVVCGTPAEYEELVALGFSS